MKGSSIVVSLGLDPDARREDGWWTVPILRLPGSEVEGLYRSDGSKLNGSAETDEGRVRFKPALEDPKGISLRVRLPADLVSRDRLEEDRLAFEREKVQIEDGWRRRRFTWTVCSALLGAVVTVIVAAINSGALSGGKSSDPLPSDMLVSCRNSLKRLPTLARLKDQTLAGLAGAVDRHVDDCDPVFESWLTSKAKEGG